MRSRSQHRIFIAGLLQETNLFSPIPTSLHSFSHQRWDPAEEPEAPDAINLLAYGGALERARELGLALHLGPYAAAVPAAPMSAATWANLKDWILRALIKAGAVESVVLFLHGAMVSADCDDCEADLLTSVRQQAGAGCRIAVIYDLHANVSESMLELADLTLACKEYPHTDFHELGRRAVTLLDGLPAHVPITTASLRIPVVALAPTTLEPMRRFLDDNQHLQDASRGEILDISVFHGFQGADHADVGGAVVVTTAGDRSLAESVAGRVAEQFIETLARLPPGADGVDAALHQAADIDGTVVLADRADNAGGGAASDSTFILQALLSENSPVSGPIALGLIWDPCAVEFCHAAGEGAVLALRIGGKSGPLSGVPVDLSVEVLALRDDVRQAWFGTGDKVLPLGRSAAVRTGDLTIVLAERRLQVFDRCVFTGHGIDPAAMKLVVVKSTQHFHRDFSALGKVVYCDAPGTLSADLSTFGFRRVQRPLWPLDPDPILPRRLAVTVNTQLSQ